MVDINYALTSVKITINKLFKHRVHSYSLNKGMVRIISLFVLFTNRLNTSFWDNSLLWNNSVLSCYLADDEESWSNIDGKGNESNHIMKYRDGCWEGCRNRSNRSGPSQVYSTLTNAHSNSGFTDTALLERDPKLRWKKEYQTQLAGNID